MSILQDEFIYNINKKTLTIKKCPNNVLDYNLVGSVLELNHIENVIVCEGVESIGVATFANCYRLKKVELPNSLITIDDCAFERCSSLTEMNLPPHLKYIKFNAFSKCSNLRKVNIPSGVEILEHNTFSNCRKLKKVNIEEGIKVIEADAFSGCSSLSKIKLPSSVNYLGGNVFKDCSNLRSIELPEGIEEINGCFHSCKKLKRVNLPNSLKKITNECFYDCSSLSQIKLPNNLEVIGNGAFCDAGLRDIRIPGSVKKIEEGAFSVCGQLFDVKFEEGLKKIGVSAFLGCRYLTSISLPNTVETIDSHAFRLCSNLRHIDLPSSLKVLNKDVFLDCVKLKQIEIPEGVEWVECGAFHRCDGLKEIHFPKSMKYFNYSYYLRDFYAPELQRIFVQCKDGEKEIDLTNKRIIDTDIGKLLLYDAKTCEYSFYNEGEYIEFHESFLRKVPKLADMIKRDWYIHEKDYINLYYWLNKKIIPSPSVILTMPIKDIDKFFVNKNCNEWAKLVKESGITNIESLNSFFKLCYVLGVFSESTSVRDKAVNFIRENIFDRLNGEMIHSKFDGFDLENGFNVDYAEFFMKYYNANDFMLSSDEDDEVIDLTCASYNNFKQVKKVYPNRVLNTNRRADLLLPEHVINAISMVEYEDVDEGNEEFATLIGRYGYTQEQFEILQEWYNKSKSIKNSEMRLFVNEDNEKKGIIYKLLDKNDPTSAVLGNITNCCQVIDGAGEECVKYGMTKPNSGFITFNHKDKIIGQSWVWYDEENKVVCLDNIEVPRKYLGKINDNKQIKESFIRCLLRVEENFKKEMETRGFEVNKVTIGKGYNDIQNVLKDEFVTVDSSTKLHGYTGYSDASNQYEIRKSDNNKRR